MVVKRGDGKFDVYGAPSVEPETKETRRAWRRGYDSKCAHEYKRGFEDGFADAIEHLPSGERYIRWSYFMIRARLQQ